MFDRIDTRFGRWAEAMFGPGGPALNKGVEKVGLMADFIGTCPAYRNQLTAKGFRRLLLLYCKRSGLAFNPHRSGMVDWRDKSNGKEYYFVTDVAFDAARPERVTITGPGDGAQKHTT